MLYRELKSSQRSHSRNRSHSNSHDKTGSGNEIAKIGSNSKRPNRCAFHSKYGRNSVVIMSTAGWQESQEHLTESSQTKLASDLGGVVKTKEVRVFSEPASSSADKNLIQLRPVEPVHESYNGSSSNS